MALALSKGKAAWAGLILTSSAERLGSTIFRWPRACPAGRMSRPLPSRSAFATKQPAPQKQPSQVEIGFSRIETALTDPPQRQGATVASFRAALLGANVSDRAAPAPTVNSGRHLNSAAASGSAPPKAWVVADGVVGAYRGHDEWQQAALMVARRCPTVGACESTSPPWSWRWPPRRRSGRAVPDACHFTSSAHGSEPPCASAAGFPSCLSREIS
jgi:hypothetical protein